MESSKLDTLVYWCNRYSEKNRILSRRLFKLYGYELLNGKKLSKNKFRHLCKFLVWDLKKGEVELYRMFKDYVEDSSSKKSNSINLEEFMV
jgi:hypothetical protein